MKDGDFSFLPVDDTAYRLTSYSGDATVVLVPSTYNGKPVTQIDNKAFGWSVTLFVTNEATHNGSAPCWRYTVNADGALYSKADKRLVCFPAGLTSIHQQAFEGCRALSGPRFPASLMGIGDLAFAGCNAWLQD